MTDIPTTAAEFAAWLAKQTLTPELAAQGERVKLTLLSFTLNPPEALSPAFMQASKDDIDKFARMWRERSQP